MSISKFETLPVMDELNKLLSGTTSDKSVFNSLICYSNHLGVTIDSLQRMAKKLNKLNDVVFIIEELYDVIRQRACADNSELNPSLIVEIKMHFSRTKDANCGYILNLEGSEVFFDESFAEKTLGVDHWVSRLNHGLLAKMMIDHVNNNDASLYVVDIPCNCTSFVQVIQFAYPALYLTRKQVSPAQLIDCIYVKCADREYCAH